MKKQDGFTLVELLIATTVFSVILLICTVGIITVGRSYYKGVTISRNQEVARNVMDDITQSIQLSGGNIQTSLTTNPSATNVRGFCINDRRYSYIPDKMLTDVNTDHAFVVDNPGIPCSAGLQPDNINNASLGDTSKEFLLPNMRVADLSILPVPGNPRLFTVHIKIVSGPNDTLNSTGPTASCRAGRIDSQYCAVTDLTSIVEKRLK